MSGHLTREEKSHWKDEVIKIRLSDGEELKKWLEQNKIPFKTNFYGISVNMMQISWTLKVKFNSSPKEYQYNLEGIKKRLSTNNKK